MIRPVLTELAIFLIPFAAYAVFLIATRSGVLVASSWPAHLVAKLVLGSLLLVVDQLRPARAVFRRAAEFDLRARPSRKRQAGRRG